MPKVSISGFKDPSRRPRYLTWSGVAVLAVIAFAIVALGATSTYWFCANGCHKVQDDTIIAYDASSHSEVNCMACHMPVGASPITFVLHKAEALGEAYLTITNTYELPLNNGSHLSQNAEHMGSEQCTQCHTTNRDITPTGGIIIDHAIHKEHDVHCALCHNRVAHPEDFELTLPGNEKHDDFMEMTACFRCHGLDPLSEAPGACGKCHPSDFELRPENHFVAGFYQEYGDSSGHAQLAAEEASRVADVEHEAEEGHDGDGLPAVDSINYCSTCHFIESFCTDCHGIEMPHPDGFEQGHGDVGRSTPQVCARCHGTKDSAGTEFCNACHHDAGDPSQPWIPQHFGVVRADGAEACFECHNPTYCAECHVRGFSR